MFLPKGNWNEDMLAPEWSCVNIWVHSSFSEEQIHWNHISYGAVLNTYFWPCLCRSQGKWLDYKENTLLFCLCHCMWVSHIAEDIRASVSSFPLQYIYFSWKRPLTTQVQLSDCEQIIRAYTRRCGPINFSDISTDRSGLDLFRGS